MSVKRKRKPRKKLSGEAVPLLKQHYGPPINPSLIAKPKRKRK